MDSISCFITQKLKPKVNEAKSAVGRPQERRFLWVQLDWPRHQAHDRAEILERFKQRIREITRRAKGVSIKTTMEEAGSYMRGWARLIPASAKRLKVSIRSPPVRLRSRAALWRQGKPRVAVVRTRSHREFSGQVATRPAAAVALWYIARSKALSSGSPMSTSNRSVSRLDRSVLA